MLKPTTHGLHSPDGGFHVDPPRGVERALITHAHSDHARSGSGAYLCAEPGVGVLRLRLGPKARITGIPYGERITLGSVQVSFHPAGHVLGSAQIRCERRGEVWVVSGDYKTEPDRTCTPFEPIRCHTFITECTFGLPLFHWRPQKEIFDEIARWWGENQARGCTSLLLSYSLGKAQRLLAGIDPTQGPIHVPRSVARFNAAYEAAGIPLPPTLPMEALPATRGRALVLAPPGSSEEEGVEGARGFTSGWMQLQRHRSARHGAGAFVLSDHADWPGLLRSVKETGATQVLATHGYVDPFVRFLREQGINAGPLEAPGSPLRPPPPRTKGDGIPGPIEGESPT